jgi:hypothetical protein
MMSVRRAITMNEQKLNQSVNFGKSGGMTEGDEGRMKVGWNVYNSPD